MILEINDLTVSYYSRQAKAVDGVRLKIPAASIFALVGESGCGKTTLGLSITNLISPRDGKIIYGSVIFEEKNILRLSPQELRDIRGRKISYIFQEPASSLNPVFTVGEQIAEALLIHKMADKKNVKTLAIDSLKEARLPDAERVFSSYPHQLSGGMKQRAMIAMAVSTRPRLLIADEPTTALDVDTEAEILELLLLLRKELSLSVLLITHNMRIVRQVADQIAIMYEGRIVEVGQADKVFNSPRHEYTKTLIDSLPENLYL
jgi:ABC-type dipeptide/oligopeptide/nickel transport system ATPase component